MENKKYIKKKNNIKRACKKIIKQCVDFYNSLSKTVKIIAVVWILIVILIVLLIALCNSNNNKLKIYETIENEMIDSAYNYIISEELYFPSNLYQRVTLEELLTSDYLNPSVNIPDSCTGYAVVFFLGDKNPDEDGNVDFEDRNNYNIESYINCKDYTTKNYSDYLK